MSSIHRILVAVKDPEARTIPTLAKAGQLARSLGAELELFHGITTPQYVDGYALSSVDLPQVEHAVRTRVVERMEKLARPLRDQKIKVTVTAEWDFPAYEAIIRQAHRSHAGLIVAEQHAGRHRAAGLLHLTDWELLRLSPAPVLLVKTPGTYRHPVVLAAVDPGHAYAKPAKLDQQILRTSGTVTRALHGALHVVHAYSPLPFEIQPTLAIGPETISRLKADAEVAARQRFDRVLRSSHISKLRRHLVRGSPDAAIENSAAELDSSIVVMGAISRSGLSKIFIGNTAERVLDHLNCDILIVRPAHFASRVSRARRGVRVMAVASGP